MQTNTIKKIAWIPCGICSGKGKRLQGPSKRARRRYQKQLHVFNHSKKSQLHPQKPTQHLDICSDCKGTGLIQSDTPLPVNNNYPHLAIIGAGIGGVALAVACQHRGIPFTLYERDEDFNARSQGYGLTLQQASKAVQGLGIIDLQQGIISSRHVVHNEHGTIIGEWGMRKWLGKSTRETSQRKNIHISRQSLRLQLLEQIDPQNIIQWGHKFIDFSMGDNGLDITFDVQGQIKKNTADIIIGADGIRSVVRSTIIDDNETPLQYLGYMVILGICSFEDLDGYTHDLLDSQTVFQTVNGYERIYIMPYDEKSIMWQFSFPLDEEYAKELNKQGSAAMKSEIIKRVKTWHDPITQIIHNTTESKITGYPIYDRDVLDHKLLTSSEHVTLIGDAAHPMSPFKGQGANQAILDALDLARSISVTCDSDPLWREGGLRKLVLHDFENRMIDRTRSKVLDSRKAVEVLHSDSVLNHGDEPRGRGVGDIN